LFTNFETASYFFRQLYGGGGVTVFDDNVFRVDFLTECVELPDPPHLGAQQVEHVLHRPLHVDGETLHQVHTLLEYSL
jgi:hypothetical protein